MKRREVIDRHFSSPGSHSYLPLFRADFICDMANSKLYFLLHGNRFAAKNACPTRGTQTLRSRVTYGIISGDDCMAADAGTTDCTTKKSDV